MFLNKFFALCTNLMKNTLFVCRTYLNRSITVINYFKKFHFVIGKVFVIFLKCFFSSFQFLTKNINSLSINILRHWFSVWIGNYFFHAFALLNALLSSWLPSLGKLFSSECDCKCENKSPVTSTCLHVAHTSNDELWFFFVGFLFLLFDAACCCEWTRYSSWKLIWLCNSLITSSGMMGGGTPDLSNGLKPRFRQRKLWIRFLQGRHAIRILTLLIMTPAYDALIEPDRNLQRAYQHKNKTTHLLFTYVR